MKIIIMIRIIRYNVSIIYLLQDYHGAKDKSSEPVKDEIDNYTLLRGEQNDTHTTIEFRRALDTCDPDDYVLTVRVSL